MTAYIKKYGEHWADELPENCPPEDVCIADNDDFYRLIHHTDHATPEDWLNTITEQPKRNVQVALVTTYGLKQNMYSGRVQRVATLEELFG